MVSRHNDSFLTDSVAFYARIPAFLAFVITDYSIPVGTFFRGLWLQRHIARAWTFRRPSRGN